MIGAMQKTCGRADRYGDLALLSVPVGSPTGRRVRRRYVLALLSAMLALPLDARAQAAKLPRVGILTGGPPPVGANPMWDAFVAGLVELGYVENRDYVFERRFAAGGFERLPALAADLVGASVNVIVVLGPDAVHAAKHATQTIPIVMVAGSSDPIGEELVASLARPGGNITGLTYAVSSERFAKQLQILKEADNRVERVAVLWDLNVDLYRRAWAPALAQAAGQLGLEIQGPVLVRAKQDFVPAFAMIAQQRADAILLATGGLSFSHRAMVADLAVQYRLPVIAAFRDFPKAGILMSYGPIITDIYRRAAIYVDKILKGIAPAVLPIEQPSKFELVVNLRTAKALGLDLPISLLTSADEVIE
jgi:putative ABC transport system substrate-binding protein